jgi:glycosyltransferase involved in cell wall biosynthesis
MTRERAENRLRILIVHNEYAKPSGEEHAAEAIAELLKIQGHEVFWFTRSSAEISSSLAGCVKAFFAGIYNPFAAKALAKTLEDIKPDIVQVQNLYPLLSASIFRPIKQRRIPIVMRCPNYRLFCPNGLHLTKGKVCEKCLGFGKEFWCVLNNCERNLFKSTGYALRNAFARMTHEILGSVNAFIVQTEFQKRKFVERGIPADRIGIVPGFAPVSQIPKHDGLGDLVSFASRVSPEKGIHEFLDAARISPNVRFAVAGRYDKGTEVYAKSPSNVEWQGFLGKSDLDDLYYRSRIIVIPSRWYEGFPNVATRAMACARPIVAARIGAMTSIVDHNRTGLLFAARNVVDLADKIQFLWSRPELCQQMGRAGREKALREFTPEKFYDSLMTVYERAMILGR